MSEVTDLADAIKDLCFELSCLRELLTGQVMLEGGIEPERLDELVRRSAAAPRSDDAA